jgi:hypothetical protein
MMMGALTIFGEDSFIFSFVGYGLVTKSPRVKLDECESFYNQIKMNHLT